MDFVNEGKHDEELKRRQAEWERVRKPDDPIGTLRKKTFKYMSKMQLSNLLISLHLKKYRSTTRSV